MTSLADLWVHAWNAAMPHIDFTPRRAWIVDRLTAAGVETVCAEAAGDFIRGFSQLEPARAYLDQLAVDPAFAGAGIGRLLLDAAKRRCPEGLALRVNEDNARARRFYERAGFVVTGRGVNPGGMLPVLDMVWRP